MEGILRYFQENRKIKPGNAVTMRAIIVVPNG